uniref:Capsid protein n=1 Tax=Chimpanzee anellovirus TaxID=1743410 RepID=A0A0S2GMI6_9VIRU|nr:ORF1 [Chimpanzee anellovirus]
MPYYWRPYKNYRRRPFRRRRIRTPVYRRRWYRRLRPWRRRRRVRKHYIKRKLKSIIIRQFQPQSIRKCNIIGTIPRFQGSPYRANNNYIQTIYSYVPQEEPGGGGWTIMIESLSSLWDDFQRLKNIWTHSNAGLPLARYQGVTLTFYQSPYTDYIVQISNCLPKVDTKYTHADSCPSRMLQRKHTIKVPSLETKKRKKPYKRIFIKPPRQMENKWYFQKDICTTPLLMIIGTAVDFRYPFAGSKARSNNITLDCLNTTLFQIHNFDNLATNGYQPKQNTYLYAYRNDEDPHDKPNTITDKEKQHVIYLGNTKDNQPGTYTFTDFTINNKLEKWGNIFWHDYFTGTIPIYESDQSPTQLNTSWKPLKRLTEPLIKKVKYNPEKDKGESNTIYLVQNYVYTAWTKPTSKNLLMEGFPLYIMCWGIIDWWEKLNEASNLLTNYIFCIETDQFSDKWAPYVVLDAYFEEGEGPYLSPITTYDQKHWHPQVRFQTNSINNICMSGPGCPRSPYENYMQAKFTYKFHFKWGGCPKTIEKPYDPCSQPIWNIPSNITERLQIENPNITPQTILQRWDWRRDYIKEKAIKRLRKYSPTNKTLQTFTEHLRSPEILRQTSEEEDSSQTSEEEKTPLKTKLKQLLRTQRILQQRLQQLE